MAMEVQGQSSSLGDRSHGLGPAGCHPSLTKGAVFSITHLGAESHEEGVGVVLHAGGGAPNAQLPRDDGSSSLEDWDLRTQEIPTHLKLQCLEKGLYVPYSTFLYNYKSIKTNISCMELYTDQKKYY